MGTRFIKDQALKNETRVTTKSGLGGQERGVKRELGTPQTANKYK